MTPFLQYLWNIYGEEYCSKESLHYPFYDQPVDSYAWGFARWLEDDKKIPMIIMFDHYHAFATESAK